MLSPPEQIPVPETMRAVVLDGQGLKHVSVQTVPTPKPGPGQLLAKVDAAGICTSLIKLAEQGAEHSYLYGWDPKAHPLILGDEGSITLVKVGEQLRDSYTAGQRFVVQPAVDHAPVNHLGRYADGGKGVFKLGVGYTLPGHLAEYMLISEEILAAGCLLPLPSSTLPHAHTALSEPLSCVVSGQEHHMHLMQSDPSSERDSITGLKKGGVTVIVGAGAMGRMHVDVALSYKPKAIVVTDFIQERLELTRTLFAGKARQVGTELHTLAGDENVSAFLENLTGDRMADDVIVAVSSPQAAEAAQHYAGRGAAINLFGGFKKGEETIRVDGNIVHYKEVNVTGSSGGSPWDMTHTLELMAEGKLEASAHITRIGDLAHAPAFLEQIKNRELDGKAVVYPHRRSDKVLEVSQWRAEDERVYLEGADA